MNPMTRWLSSLLVLAVIGTIARTEAATVNRDSSLRVEGAHADDRGVHVTIANPAPVARSGVLLVKAFVGGSEVDLPVSFHIEAGATASFDVKLPLGATLVDVTIVLDDGSPF